VTAAHRRAAAREREAANVLGTRRVRRSRYESAPDVERVQLADGTVLSVEVKSRARLPALLRDAIAQATRYAPDGAVPVAVVSEKGGTALACVPLRAFAALVGVAPPLPPAAKTLFSEPTTTLADLEKKVA
jgi:hypothetical protein